MDSLFRRSVGAVVVLGLGGCDHGPKVPTTDTVDAFRGAAMPQAAPPTECEPSFPVVQPQTQVSYPASEFEDRWLRVVTDVLAIADNDLVTTGTVGDPTADGMFIAALQEGGAVRWRHIIPFDEDEFERHYLRHAINDSIWWVASARAQSVVRQYDADGIEIASTPLADLSVTAVEARPDGGLLLLGVESTSSQAPAFAGLDPDGAIEWQGDAVMPSFDRVVARGDLQRLDASGSALWTHDPRPTPFAQLPDHPGAQWARLLPGGNTAVFGSVLGDGGWVAQLLWLDPAGTPLVEVQRRDLTVTHGQRLSNGWVSVHGIASECERVLWHGVYDEQGAMLHEGIVAATSYRRAMTVDSSQRPVVVHVTGTAIAVERFAEVAP